MEQLPRLIHQEAAAGSPAQERSYGMSDACPYGFGKTVALDYEIALSKVLDLLRARGFSVLSQVDMREALRPDSGGGLGRYMIITACSPALARRAFSADSNIGLLFPCNVVVYEEDEGGSTVMAMDPAYLMDLLRVPETIEVAIAIREEFEALIEMI